MTSLGSIFEVTEIYIHATLSLMLSAFVCDDCTKGQRKKQKKKEKKRNAPIYIKTNYHTEMKLTLIIMDYCLLQFDALKFFLGCVYMESLYLTLIFSG